VLETGVVHQDVDIQVLPGQSRRIGQIDRPGLAADLVGYLPGAVTVAVCHDDARTGVGKVPRAGLSYPARTPGYERGPSRNAHVSSKPALR
jgi:hypothetical protein